MPIQNTIGLERAQAKIEATRGTAETTMTRWLYPIQGGLTWTYERDQDNTKEHTRGFHQTQDVGLGISRSRINFEGVVTFEEVVWWLRMILKGSSGALAGTSTGSTPPGYTYSFTPNSSADDLNTFTLKCGDGVNNYLFNRCAVNRATLRWNPISGGEATWRMTLEILARFGAAGVSMDTPTELARTKVIAAGTKVFSDAIGGTIGTTQVLAKVRSGSITIDNQIEEKLFSEDTDVVSADFARGEQIVTAELLMEFKDDVEFGYFRSATDRKIRIEKVGPNIGSTPTTDNRLRIDLPVARIVSFVPGYTGMNKTATVGLVGQRSQSSPQPITIEVVNALASVAA